jgi:regulator of protease activity HflC (stomatin/prohibitin superfamily)
MDNVVERNAWKTHGFLAVFLGLLFGVIGFLVVKNTTDSIPLMITGIFLIIVSIIFFAGLLVIQPNEAKVLVFFGKYIGSVKESGFWWINPFTVRKSVSLKVHNQNSEKLKVNDLTGNPIEIAAVVVWRVVDTAKAVFDVERYEQFVVIQCETAIRALANEYSYDSHEDGKPSLRGSQAEVSDNLRKQVQARLNVTGVEVSETRISHLAYSPEIAQVMLRRQQAQAIIAARQIIVDGAVGMVEGALRMLGDKKIVTLDDDKKASMINNLLVALISDHEATPVINTGTLYA